MATKTFTGTGLASATARWSGGTLPIAGDKVVIAAGADCTLDGAYPWGDGTSSTTLANNAIVVPGTLRGHATIPWSLTCVGSLVEGPGGSIVFDQSAGGSGTLILNSGGTIGQHGFVTLPGSGSCSVTVKGIPRTRNTTLSAAASGTSITVTASVGWAIGDSVVIASPDDSPANSILTTIVGGSSPTWTLAASVMRSAGCLVGNLSSNMIVKASSSAAGAVFTAQAQTGSCTAQIDNVDFVDIYSNAGWSQSGGIQYNGVCLFCDTDQSITNCSVRWTHSLTTQGNAALLVVNGNSTGYSIYSNCALYSPAGSGSGFRFSNGALARTSGNVLYRSNVCVQTSGGAGGFDCLMSGDALWASVNAFDATSGSVLLQNCEVHSAQFAATYSNGRVSMSGGTFSCATRLLNHTLAGLTGVDFNGTSLYGASLSASNTSGSIPSKLSVSRLYSVSGVSSDNREINYHRVATSDVATRKNGTTSVKLQPMVAGVSALYIFTIPAVTGVAQTIKGALRFDSTYGTATPPVISLSGQGVTSSYTCAAVADAWSSFALSFTPTSTGNITVTVTLQSASASGYAWLDGVYHYPMIQSVRHWGYQWLPQAAQLVDTRITLTEAAALALPVSVNHGTSTVTISGSVTPSAALQAMLADLVQPANQGTPVHVTGDGSTFVTSYAVVFGGAGAVTGPYTDATGLHVSVTSSALDAGTLVQVWDVAASTELYIGTPSGALALPIVYPGTDKTLRLRAMQCGATSASLFVEQLGTLTSAGASFLVTQLPDLVYAANEDDGSAVTGITIDDTHLLIELTGAPVSVGGVMVILVPCPMIYAYETYWLSTIAGIRDEGRIIHAVDTANYLMTGFKLKNISGYPALLTNGWMRDSVTGETATLIDFSGDPIFSHPDAVVAYGQAAATPAEIWSHASRTLTGTTVADVRYVNGIIIDGAGTESDPWGPA